MSPTKRITKLTPEQEARLQEIVTKWAAIGRSTQPADRDRAEKAICGLYNLAKLPEPRVIWVPCPLSGALSLVYATLVAMRAVPPEAGPIPKKWPVRSWLESTVMSSLGSTADSAVGSAVSSALDSAIHSARYLNAADSAVGWKVRTAFESAFTSAVDSVCLAVSSAVRSAVESAVMTAVYWSASAHNSMFDAIFYPTVYSSQIDVAVGLAVGSTSMILAARSAGSSAVYPTVVDRAVHSTVASRFGGSQWLGASAWADFFNDAGITSIDRNYLELVESCGYIWTLDGVCFACDRPSRLKLDDRGRLHSETGQSIKYPSGWGLWHWHGVSVPQFIIEQPERITVRSIQKEVNVEVRRVMIERYGQARYLVDSGAKLIHADDMGELYSTDIPGDEPLVMVKVMNSTPEPDGSRKPYFLRVHPECRLMLTNGEFGERQPMTARSAVASTFGMTADEYAKHLITET